MSSTKAITETPQQPLGRPEGPLGPSPLREDDLAIPRGIGLVSGCLVLLGGLVMVMKYGFGRTTLFGPAWGSIGLVIGLFGLLFHAAVDRALEYRLLYRFLGWALLVIGAFVCLLPNPKVGALFPVGYPLMALGLLFQIAPLRTETDAYWRNLTQWVLGGAGAILALVGLLGGFWFAGDINKDFLLPTGLLVAILGLVYLIACVISKGTSDDLSYRIALGIGALGALVFVLSLVRSLWPGLFQAGSSNFLLPWGLLLMALSGVYVAVSIGLVSDSRLVIMTRRELGAFFYSPIAYMILLGFAFCQWLTYYLVASQLIDEGQAPEPIVANFILQWPSIFFVMFAVPALTMRLLSEERRTGTLEVTMTTPVNEVQVVLSKFIAAWLMYMLMWLPFAFYLIAFRVGTGTNFDYRPLLSFSIGLMVTGAGFISMGLFFSTLTRNQIISGVLTFTGMLGLTLVFMLERYLSARSSGMGMAQQLPSMWVGVLKHISYVNVWLETMQGQLVLKQLVAPLTATIWWLFLSVKVLEARKWL